LRKHSSESTRTGSCLHILTISPAVQMGRSLLDPWVVPYVDLVDVHVDHFGGQKKPKRWTTCLRGYCIQEPRVGSAKKSEVVYIESQSSQANEPRHLFYFLIRQLTPGSEYSRLAIRLLGFGRFHGHPSGPAVVLLCYKVMP
jgi:hypothetical protein